MENLIAYTPLLLRGALVTIALALVGLALATLLGALGAAGKIGGGPIARSVVFLYTTIVRGIPDLVLILLIYFGGQRILNAFVVSLGSGPIDRTKYWIGAMSLLLIYIAYLTTKILGRYKPMPNDLTDAARKSGSRQVNALSQLQISQRVRFAVKSYARVWPKLVLPVGVVFILFLLIYFGGQYLLKTYGSNLGAGRIELSKFWAGSLAIGFIYGAYLTETFRGAYMTIPRGQIEAARALGMKRFSILWKVTLPQLVRFAIAGYANVWQVLIKSTAVVSVISLQDLVGLANDAGKSVREPFTFFAAVFMMYLLFTFVSQNIFNWLERKYTIKGRKDAA